MKSPYGMVFYSKNIEYIPENISALLASLQKDGFIGEPFSSDFKQQRKTQTGYLIGQEFLKLLTFLGCSPHIAMTPPEQLKDWGNFCYMEIQHFQAPKYFKGLNRPKCSCPVCKSRVASVLPELQQWLPGSQRVICAKCQQATLAENLNWRHDAGFGRFFIVINSIYPNEAVPTDKLMKVLNSASGENWDYFYFER